MCVRVCVSGVDCEAQSSRITCNSRALRCREALYILLRKPLAVKVVVSYLVALPAVIASEAF